MPAACPDLNVEKPLLAPFLQLILAPSRAGEGCCRIPCYCRCRSNFARNKSKVREEVRDSVLFAHQGSLQSRPSDPRAKCQIAFLPTLLFFNCALWDQKRRFSRHLFVFLLVWILLLENPRKRKAPVTDILHTTYYKNKNKIKNAEEKKTKPQKPNTNTNWHGKIKSSSY